MPACPACQRPVALARAVCAYCGASLPAAERAEAERLRQTARPLEAPSPSLGHATGSAASGRVLLVIGFQGHDTQAVSEALQLDLYEARQRQAAGGAQLWRSAPASQAQAEAQRLRAAGVEVHALDEDEVRQQSVVAVVSGGAFDGRRLRLRADKQERSLVTQDLLLVVRGPIAREVLADPTRPTPKHRQPPGSTSSGYRFHLHARAASEWALELDPETFEFDDARDGQAPYLTLHRWIDTLAVGVSQDDGFRRLTPALGPAASDSGPGARLASAFSQGAHGRTQPARTLLDNLAQFRFYSAWRGLVERRRLGPAAASSERDRP